MWKNLLVFALAFCLGLISLQIIKNKINSNEFEVVSNTVTLEKPATSLSSQDISRNSSPLFEDCIIKFKKAVAENDKETLAALMHFPIFVGLMDEKDKPYFKEIKNSDEFVANYNKIFGDSFKKCITQMKLDQMYYKSRHEASIYSAVKINRSIYSFKLEMKGYKNNDRDVEIKITNLFRSYTEYLENKAIQKLF